MIVSVSSEGNITLLFTFSHVILTHVEHLYYGVMCLPFRGDVAAECVYWKRPTDFLHSLSFYTEANSWLIAMETINYIINHNYEYL